MRNQTVLFLLTLLTLASLSWSAWGEEVSGAESAAMAFVEQHHQELADLLKQLKKTNRKDYDSAIRDLGRTQERLEKFQARQPDRYAAEVEIWKLESRVRLLVARFVSAMDEQTRDEIQRLIQDRNAIRARLLREDRDRMAARLEKLDESLREIESAGDRLAAEEAERLLRSARSHARPGKAPVATGSPVPGDTVRLKSGPKSKVPETK